MQKLNLKINIFILIIFIIYFFSFPHFKTSIAKFSNPFFAKINFQNIFVTKSYLNFQNYFSGLENLALRNKSLEQDLEDRESEIMNLKENFKENSLTINNVSLGTNFVEAKILNQDYFKIYESVILNKGFVDGVSKGDEVYLYPNYFLGNIERIENDKSIFSLASGHKKLLKGVLKDNSQNNLVIDLLGLGGGDFAFEIPESILISTGTLIYLYKDPSKLIGEIIGLEKLETSLYQKVLVRGYYNLATSGRYYIKVR